MEINPTTYPNFFILQEAQDLLGRKVRTRKPWQGLPEGCEGEVSKIEPMGTMQDDVEIYFVYVFWSEPEFEGWFTKGSFNRNLQVEEEDELLKRSEEGQAQVNAC